MWRLKTPNGLIVCLPVKLHFGCRVDECTEPASSLLHTLCVCVFVNAGDSAVLEEESPSRGTYTVNNVPVSVERHTPRQYDGIQRPTVEGYSASQSAAAPRSSGKKRRLETDAEYWAGQGYARDPDSEGLK